MSKVLSWYIGWIYGCLYLYAMLYVMLALKVCLSGLVYYRQEYEDTSMLFRLSTIVWLHNSISRC